jgi:hypothetical protein
MFGLRVRAIPVRAALSGYDGGMPQKPAGVNPFYVFLIVLGIAFALTACAYSVMTFRAVRVPSVGDESAGGAALLDFLDRHGGQLMAGELALLAVATMGAIGTDRYWMRRAYREHPANRLKPPPEQP